MIVLGVLRTVFTSSADMAPGRSCLLANTSSVAPANLCGWVRIIKWVHEIQCTMSCMCVVEREERREIEAREREEEGEGEKEGGRKRERDGRGSEGMMVRLVISVVSSPLRPGGHEAQPYSPPVSSCQHCPPPKPNHQCSQSSCASKTSVTFDLQHPRCSILAW